MVFQPIQKVAALPGSKNGGAWNKRLGGRGEGVRRGAGIPCCWGVRTITVRGLEVRSPRDYYRYFELLDLWEGPGKDSLVDYHRQQAKSDRNIPDPPNPLLPTFSPNPSKATVSHSLVYGGIPPRAAHLPSAVQWGRRDRTNEWTFGELG